ncbi:MAG: glycosyltransferase family 39 protein [Thermoflexales bacterium]|nr:glycosyltransferase family 39 protein [Thermoflexales bacterium]
MQSTGKSWGVVIVLLTLLAQLPLMLKVKIVEYDEAIFCDVARNIRYTGLPLRSIGRDGVFFFDHTLLYLYLLSTYVGAGTFFCRGITTLFSLCCVFLVYIIGHRVGGRIAGFISALVVGVQPFFALYSFFIRMEIFCLFFLLAGLAVLSLEAWGISNKKMVITGVALAIAVLFKEIALVFVAICGVYILVKFRKDRLALGKALLLVVAPPVLALLVWGIWCWHLSPEAFIAVMQRWMGAAAMGGQDPRSSLTPLQWMRRIVVELLGPGLTILWAGAVVYSVVRKRLEALDWILLGYPGGAILLSFFIRLKEPRHLIGILPVIALFIGIKVEWESLWIQMQGNRLRQIISTILALMLVFSASPMRLPLRNVSDPRSWLDPLYAWRLFENDRYYNVLRLTGLYLQNHTEPKEIITVVHEATVTAYYANRHYNMLYTLPLERVMQVLAGTRYLVWDHEVFLALNEGQIYVVREYVNQHFEVEQVIRDDYREVTIYRRREG